MARDFATNDNISYGDINALDSNTEFTLMIDAYLDDVTVDHAFISKQSAANPTPFTISFDAVSFATSNTDTFTLFCRLSDDSFERVESSQNSAVTGRWSRVLSRRKSNTVGGMYLKVLDYTTGVITKYTAEAPSTTANVATATNSNNVQVGEHAQGGGDMDGRLANAFAVSQTFTDSQEDAMLRTNPLIVMGSRPEILDAIHNADSTSSNWGTETNGTITGTIPKIAGPPTVHLENYM